MAADHFRDLGRFDAARRIRSDRAAQYQAADGIQLDRQYRLCAGRPRGRHAAGRLGHAVLHGDLRADDPRLLRRDPGDAPEGPDGGGDRRSLRPCQEPALACPYLRGGPVLDGRHTAADRLLRQVDGVRGRGQSGHVRPRRHRRRHQRRIRLLLCAGHQGDVFRRSGGRRLRPGRWLAQDRAAGFGGGGGDRHPVHQSAAELGHRRGILSLPGMSLAFRIEQVAEIDSTNEACRLRAAAGEAAGLVIRADRQTAGRGRRGRNWISPSGNLYASLLLRPSRPVSESAALGFAAVTAIGDVAEALLPATATVQHKWPNDLLINGRKASGLLLEAQPGFLVLGIGVNILSHPAGTPYPATDLAAEGAAPITAQSLLERFLKSFAPLYEVWE